MNRKVIVGLALVPVIASVYYAYTHAFVDGVLDVRVFAGEMLRAEAVLVILVVASWLLALVTGAAIEFFLDGDDA